jgi:hypothetical protein
MPVLRSRKTVARGQVLAVEFASRSEFKPNAGDKSIFETGKREVGGRRPEVSKNPPNIGIPPTRPKGCE